MSTGHTTSLLHGPQGAVEISSEHHAVGGMEERVARRHPRGTFLSKGLARGTSTPVHQRPRNMEPARTRAIQEGAHQRVLQSRRWRPLSTQGTCTGHVNPRALATHSNQKSRSRSEIVGFFATISRICTYPFAKYLDLAMTILGIARFRFHSSRVSQIAKTTSYPIFSQ